MKSPMGFTSRELQQTIAKSSNKLRSKPVLFDRFEPRLGLEHVWIAPLLTSDEEADVASSFHEQLPTYREEQPKEFLDLRLCLGKPLDENLVAKLAKALDRFSREEKEPLGIENIRLIPHPYLVKKIATHWRKRISKHKDTRDETRLKLYEDPGIDMDGQILVESPADYTNDDEAEDLHQDDTVQPPRKPQRLRIDLQDLMTQILGMPKMFLNWRLLFTLEVFIFGIMLAILLCIQLLSVPDGEVFVFFTNLTLY